MMLDRRGFLSGVFSAFAAPAIVRFDSIMPVKAFPPYMFPVNATIFDEYLEAMSQQIARTLIYGLPTAPVRFSGFVPLTD